MDMQTLNERLNETIAWCSAQQLISDPVEDESITRRRLLNQRGAKLSAQSFMALEPYKTASWFSRWIAKKKFREAMELARQAKELFAEGDAGAIEPPLRKQLRSKELNPSALSLSTRGADCEAIVNRVVEARSLSLRQSGTEPNAQVSDLSGGRLLLYAPEENLACGAAEYVSLGFFDVNNAPPWDTWVAMSGKYLISWVPGQLFELAEQGVDINPELCIIWADDPTICREPVAELLAELKRKVA